MTPTSFGYFSRRRELARGAAEVVLCVPPPRLNGGDATPPYRIEPLPTNDRTVSCANEVAILELLQPKMDGDTPVKRPTAGLAGPRENVGGAIANSEPCHHRLLEPPASPGLKDTADELASSTMFTPDFDDPHTYRHVQLLCEVHRYGADVGYKTDSVTAHGLDEGDRQALLSAYAHKVNERMVRNCPRGTLIFNDVERMNILNVLALERGFIVQSSPDISAIPNKPGTTDFRCVIAYPIVKRCISRRISSRPSVAAMAVRHVLAILAIMGIFTADIISAGTAECLEDYDCPFGRYCNFKSGIPYCEQCVDCSLLNREPSRCLEDYDCPVGRYCNFKSGILYCEQCVDCSMLNREPSRSVCARSRGECGACLPGCVDERLIYNRWSDFCQPSPDPFPNTTDGYNIADVAGLPTAVVILICALAFVVVAILGVLGIYGLRKWKRSSALPAPAVQDRRSSTDAEGQPCLHSVPTRESPPPSGL